MQKYLVLLAGASMLAFLFPSAFERYRDRLREVERAETIEAPGTIEAAIPAPAAASAPAPAGRTARLEAGRDGHFRTEARLNGRAVDVLVDTGATYVSMNEATAQRLGLRLRPSDFRFKAQTANGQASVAVATLDRVRIGAVEIRDVETVVSRGSGLSTTLLGMSFLKKLKRFEVQSGRLNLVQ